MKLYIELECDNAAFTEEGVEVHQEVAAILKDLTEDLDSILLDDLAFYEDTYKLHDHNGNTVGRVRVEK
jgi:hypothetical protein